MTRVLILGGTAEARQLAQALTEALPALDVVTALAGATTNPAPLKGRVRVGGFGGADGLAAYLKNEAIDLVIDATHPFAQRITANAVAATTQTGVPYLRLDRPAWVMPDDCDVVYVPDAIEAARLVARTSKAVLLTTGRKDLGAFKDLGKTKIVARVIDRPTPDPLDGQGHYVIARPPFALDDEMALMRTHGIDTLVTKASGGNATEAKLLAAQKVGARIVAIRRPVPPEGERVFVIGDALAWVRSHI